jgi:uncharacterized SAM-binding protein YcdF (DUF218 family)
MSIFKKMFLWLLMAGFLWGAGLFWFLAQIPNTPSQKTQPAEAIVVLTGGSGRIEQGFRLLAAGSAPRLFITGAGDDVRVQDVLRQAPPEILTSLNPTHITLGKQAENTIGNAEETAVWLRANHANRIYLVTSSYHIPRSISEFKTLMPTLEILPSPVFTDDFSLTDWWKKEDSRALVFSEYHKYLASKLRHLLLSVT